MHGHPPNGLTSVLTRRRPLLATTGEFSAHKPTMHSKKTGLPIPDIDAERRRVEVLEAFELEAQGQTVDWVSLDLKACMSF